VIISKARYAKFNYNSETEIDISSHFSVDVSTEISGIDIRK